MTPKTMAVTVTMTVTTRLGMTKLFNNLFLINEQGERMTQYLTDIQSADYIF